MQLNVYLHFKGECEEAFKFYEKVLGGKIEALMTHAGTPMEKNCPPEWRNKIIHGRMKLGDQIIMASDVPPEHYSNPQGFSVSLMVNDPAVAEKMFQELSENGIVKMPIQKTFWAYRFGMCVDKFGTPWMINCEKAP